MDVLIRAVMSALLTSHGLRQDVEVILHLQGGPGPHRRLKFIGSELKGFHAEERSVAGLVAKAIKEPMPAIGHWIERTPGLYDCLLYTSPSPRDLSTSRMPSSA